MTRISFLKQLSDLKVGDLFSLVSDEPAYKILDITPKGLSLLRLGNGIIDLHQGNDPNTIINFFPTDKQVAEELWNQHRVLPKVASHGHYSQNPGCSQKDFDSALVAVKPSGVYTPNPYSNWRTLGVMFMLLLLSFCTSAQAIPKTVNSSPARTIVDVQYLGGGIFSEIMNNGDTVHYRTSKTVRATKTFTARLFSTRRCEAFGTDTEYWVVYYCNEQIEAVVRGMWTQESWRRLYLFEIGKGFQPKPDYVK